MPFYSYAALDRVGKKVKGSITALNEIDLEKKLHSLDLDLVRAKVTSGKSFSVSSRVSLKDLIFLCIHLEQLERAGVPLLDSLADLRDTADSLSVKNLMADIYESVEGGAMLSEAMETYPKIFSKVFTGLISAGEKTGSLADIFAHLAKHMKWVHDIRSKIKKALYYPAFLLILMMGIVALMMTFVIPKLSSFLLAQNFTLPFYTTALIATSHFFVNYWYVIFLGPFVVYFTLVLALRASYELAYAVDSFLLSLPIIGGVLRKIDLARFTHFFAITFRSGVPMLDCLEIAHNVVRNRVIKEGVLSARRAVSEGSSLHNALRSTGQFPSLVLRMFKVGEDSGNMEETLENVTFFYDREVDDAVNNMVGFVQPALTIILGGLMLWISIAVFGPLYSSFSQIQY